MLSIALEVHVVLLAAGCILFEGRMHPEGSFPINAPCYIPKG